MHFHDSFQINNTVETNFSHRIQQIQRLSRWFLDSVEIVQISIHSIAVPDLNIKSGHGMLENLSILINVDESLSSALENREYFMVLVSFEGKMLVWVATQQNHQILLGD